MASDFKFPNCALVKSTTSCKNVGKSYLKIGLTFHTYTNFSIICIAINNTTSNLKFIHPSICSLIYSFIHFFFFTHFVSYWLHDGHYFTWICWFFASILLLQSLWFSSPATLVLLVELHGHQSTVGIIVRIDTLYRGRQEKRERSFDNTFTNYSASFSSWHAARDATHYLLMQQLFHYTLSQSIHFWSLYCTFILIIFLPFTSCLWSHLDSFQLTLDMGSSNYFFAQRGKVVSVQMNNCSLSLSLSSVIKWGKHVSSFHWGNKRFTFHEKSNSFSLPLLQLQYILNEFIVNL